MVERHGVAGGTIRCEEATNGTHAFNITWGNRHFNIQKIVSLPPSDRQCLASREKPLSHWTLHIARAHTFASFADCSIVFVLEHVEEGRYTEHAQYTRKASRHSHFRFKIVSRDSSHYTH